MAINKTTLKTFISLFKGDVLKNSVAYIFAIIVVFMELFGGRPPEQLKNCWGGFPQNSYYGHSSVIEQV